MHKEKGQLKEAWICLYCIQSQCQLMFHGHGPADPGTAQYANTSLIFKSTLKILVVFYICMRHTSNMSDRHAMVVLPRVST